MIISLIQVLASPLGQRGLHFVEFPTQKLEVTTKKAAAICLSCAYVASCYKCQGAFAKQLKIHLWPAVPSSD